MVETDRGKEFLQRTFTDFLNKKKIKNYIRYTSIGAVFAERFNRTIRDPLKKPVILRGDVN